METFDIAVLPRTAWIDVAGFDVVILQLLLHFGGDKFRAIVTADIAGHAILDHRLFQNG